MSKLVIPKDYVTFSSTRPLARPLISKSADAPHFQNLRKRLATGNSSHPTAVVDHMGVSPPMVTTGQATETISRADPMVPHNSVASTAVRVTVLRAIRAKVSDNLRATQARDSTETQHLINS
jgi:hypothetical protein